MKITDKTALKAAEAIREYCRIKPNSCEGCVFHTEIERMGAYRFCLVDDPYHLPKTWESERIGKER